MKRHLLWTFDRGSFQWDILCLLILAFLFLIPRNVFNDVPEFMKVSATETVHKTVDNLSRTAYSLEQSLMDPLYEAGALYRGIRRGLRTVFGRTGELTQFRPSGTERGY